MARDSKRPVFKLRFLLLSLLLLFTLLTQGFDPAKPLEPVKIPCLSTTMPRMASLLPSPVSNPADLGLEVNFANNCRPKGRLELTRSPPLAGIDGPLVASAAAAATTSGSCAASSEAIKALCPTKNSGYSTTRATPSHRSHLEKKKKNGSSRLSSLARWSRHLAVAPRPTQRPPGKRGSELLRERRCCRPVAERMEDGFGE